MLRRVVRAKLLAILPERRLRAELREEEAAVEPEGSDHITPTPSRQTEVFLRCALLRTCVFALIKRRWEVRSNVLESQLSIACSQF